MKIVFLVLSILGISASYDSIQNTARLTAPCTGTMQNGERLAPMKKRTAYSSDGIAQQRPST